MHNCVVCGFDGECVLAMMQTSSMPSLNLPYKSSFFFPHRDLLRLMKDYVARSGSFTGLRHMLLQLAYEKHYERCLQYYDFVVAKLKGKYLLPSLP